MVTSLSSAVHALPYLFAAPMLLDEPVPQMASVIATVAHAAEKEVIARRECVGEEN